MRTLPTAMALVFLAAAAPCQSAPKPKGTLERVATGSQALRQHLKQNPAMVRTLLEDEQVRSVVERDPVLGRRLRDDPQGALADDELLTRLLDVEVLRSAALSHPELRLQVDEELAPYLVQMEAAGQARARGDLVLAAKTFARAAREGEQLGNDAARAEALYAQAGALRRKSSQRDAEPSTLDESLRLYAEVIESGDARLSTLARNGLAVAHLDRGDAARAFATLRAFTEEGLAAVGAETRPYLHFNRARASESTERPSVALIDYKTTLDALPDFQPAVDGAYRVALMLEPDVGAREVATLSRQLTAAGQPRRAVRQMPACLRTWNSEAAVRVIGPALLDSYTAAGLGVQEFRLGEKPWLTGIAADSPAVGALLEDLELVYEAEWDIARSGRETGNRFVHDIRDGATRNAWAGILRQAAVDYDNRGNTSQAFARLVSAWKLDRNNTGPIVDIADALVRDPSLVAEHEEFFEEFADAVFDAKTKSYLHAFRSPAAWLDILRYHVLLGTIYSDRRQWGPPSQLRSAIFQFRHALSADEMLRGFDPERPPSPGLHYRLGLAWQGAARAAKVEPGAHERVTALSHLFEATLGFIETRAAADARRALDAARAMKPPVPEQYDARDLLRERGGPFARVQLRIALQGLKRRVDALTQGG